MQEEKLLSEIIKIKQISETDKRYHYLSYIFVLNALNFYLEATNHSGHLSGKQLLEGIRLYGLKLFGPLTRLVLRHWGIITTNDFGNIVLNLVDKQLLSKQETDTYDEFNQVYQFTDVFDNDDSIYKEFLDLSGEEEEIFLS